jgi:hypothetical protein
MADERDCPDCNNPMRLYGAKASVDGASLTIGAEIIEYICVVVLPILLWTVGITGVPLVIASALIVVVAVLWKPNAQRRNEEQSALYYCDACDSYFEGSRLRRVTEAEKKRAI